jgi:CcmD family protein
MRAWSFVFLAYGIVWGTIVLYLISLMRRYHKAEVELARLSSPEETYERAEA